MNPFDLDERLREADEAEIQHEAEETARRALRSDPDEEDERQEPPDD